MKHVFVDESIHDRGDFICLAAVCSDSDLNDSVDECLSRNGFQPKRDEFKSSSKMAADPAMRNLRNELCGLLFEKSKIAVGICPNSERAELLAHVGKLISNLDQSYLATGGTIYSDQGMGKAIPSLPSGWSLQSECDSRAISGIQLADLAAHSISTIILGELGLVDKVVSTNGHYPEPFVELTWELWTDLRYAMATNNPIGGFDGDGYCEPMMKSFGLHISDGCPPNLKLAAEQRLSEIWLGCIH